MRETKKHWVWRILAIFGIWGIGAAGCTDDGTDNNNGDNGKDTSTESEGEDTGTGEVVEMPEASCADANAKLEECGLIDSGSFSCGERTNYLKCMNGCITVVSCDVLAETMCVGDDESLDAFVEECSFDCFDMVFTCNDGEEIESQLECNADPDCEDGSDEHDGCGVFTCDDGVEIPDDYECDGEFDCSDGSDEHDGCAAFSCP